MNRVTRTDRCLNCLFVGLLLLGSYMMIQFGYNHASVIHERNELRTLLEKTSAENAVLEGVMLGDK